MKFKVEISKWVCGTADISPKNIGIINPLNGIGASLLLNSQGYMCCLGHCMLQEGFSEEEIKGKGMPNSVESDNVSVFVDKGRNTYLARRAANINDQHNFALSHKQRALIELFKEHGHELEFV